MEDPALHDGESHANVEDLATQVRIAQAECHRLAQELAHSKDQAEEDRNRFVSRVEAAESQLASVTRDYQREREDLEQHVKRTGATLEKHVEALQKQLKSRDLQVLELHDENSGLNRAFIEVKSLLKESNAERQGLAEELQKQQEVTKTVKISVSKAEAEAEAAKKELADSIVALADAKAEVWAVREAARAKALGGEERRELEAALKALSASVQQANEEASIWKNKAQSQMQEVSSQSIALAKAVAEISVLQLKITELKSQAEEAMRSQSEAENMSSRLSKDTERRAHAFNGAVRAAVSKIRADLEAERDAALVQMEVMRSEAMLQTMALQEVNERLSSELSMANVKISEFEKEKMELSEEVINLEQQVFSLKFSSDGSEGKTELVLQQAQAMTMKMEKLEARCHELQTIIETILKRSTMQELLLQADIAQWKQVVSKLEDEKNLLQVVSSDRQSQMINENTNLHERVLELERQLRSQEEQKPLFLKVGDQPDFVQEERLRSRDKMLSIGNMQDIQKTVLRHQALLKDKQSKRQEDCCFGLVLFGQQCKDSFKRGPISGRALILFVYIITLHIIV